MTEPSSDKTFSTDSGIPLQPYYEKPIALGSPPGTFPFTRGIRATGYRERLWTMRQYAGFGTARETNQRFHQLLDSGQTGLSIAFDLPTQMGLDSDDPRAQGEVGKVGVAIDSLADMEILLDKIPLDRVTTSMTINAPASALLLLYELAAEKAGIDSAALGGTVQNDILKEYAARGTYIFPPQPSMRLTTDTFSYAAQRLPRWHPISVSGYHMREAGATASQEVAFCISNAIAYLQAALDAGMTVQEFAPRISFFFNVSNDFFEEVAKFRAARTLWAHIVRERFHCDDDRCRQLRFHTQTSGATLTAQQPLNNIARVALQAMAAVCGGTQSLHTNSYDEALALPSEQAAEVALRTQQIIACESGAPRVADPLGGSYLVETLTKEIVTQATNIISTVDEYGGALPAIESGFYQSEIENAAYRLQQSADAGDRQVVGVNAFTATVQRNVEAMPIHPHLEAEQVQRIGDVRRQRDQPAVDRALAELADIARGSNNLLFPMRDALSQYATVGEVCHTLRTVFGSYESHPTPR